MLITQEEIEDAVRQFVRTAIRYEPSSTFGVRDHGDTFDQVKESVVVQLLLDLNAVYYLLSIGAKRQTTSLIELIAQLDAIDTLLDSFKVMPQPDLVVDDQLSRVESVLRNQQYVGASRTAVEIDTLSLRLGRALVRNNLIVLPIHEARDQLSTALTEIDDIYVILLDELRSLSQGYEDFAASTALYKLEQRVLGAAQSLLFDMRLERVDTDTTASQQTARSRLIELQAAKQVITQLTKTADGHANDRILTGTSPTGNDLRLYPTAPAVSVPSQQLGSGGFFLTSQQTLIVSTGDNSPSTVTFSKTSEINLIGKSVPTPAAAGEALYFSIGEAEFDDVVFSATIVEPATYLGGPPALGNLAHGYLSAAISDAIVGHTIGLSYQGDLAALTTDQKKAVEANTGQYRVIGYDGRSALATPVLKLDPPLPAGYSSSVPLTNWQFFSVGLFARWEAPTTQGAYGSYLARLIAELSGPTDPSNFDVYQHWRIHTKVTGTGVGNFLPGERVVNTTGTVGSKQGIVVHHNGNDLYVLEMASPFSPGDDVQGYESGATLTAVSAVVAQVAERAGNSGNLNQARYVEALSSSVLHLQGRSKFGGGSDATIDDGGGSAGNILTIGAGDRGLWEMGLFNGSKIVVNGVEYTIDVITNNKLATIVGSALHVNLSWYVPVPSSLLSINMPTFGPRFRARLFDVTTQVAAAPASGFTAGDAFLLRTNYLDGAEFVPANTLEMDLPQFDSAQAMSAQEVIEDIRLAQVPGLSAQEVRTTLYSHPEESAAITLTQGSDQAVVPTSLPSDDETASLVGYYLVPEEGPHRDLSFLILSDTAGPRTLTFDRVARVTDALTAYRIESRRPSLSVDDTSATAKLVFGAGTAHSLLGAPVSTTVYGAYDRWELREKQTAQDLGSFELVKGDKISSPLQNFPDNVILELATTYMILETAMSGALAGEAVRVAGECPSQWTAFVQQFRRALAAYQERYATTDSLRLAAFSLLNSNLSIQESDLAVFSRELSDMKTSAEQVLNVLQSLAVPDVPAGRRIIEALEEYNYDATLFQLTHGRYEEFFSEGAEQATRAGRIQTLLALTQRGLGETDQSSVYEEFADTPVIVNSGVEEEDERDGSGFDQFQDDEDTGDEGIT
ncbi:MAG: hypothetical protein KDB07_04000 [Planctomycetes bacterium]|nr:hypothetical protein [Planctomycetota bacterium]